MKAKLSRKIRSKVDGHPTHSELVAWAEAAERLEKKIERQREQIEALAKRLQIDWIEEGERS
jgi:DNA/RNA-binding domain of Phe-tRNA-synthetase-like protein